MAVTPDSAERMAAGTARPHSHPPAGLSARQWWALAGVTYIVSLLLLVVGARADLTKEFFFDEAWRVDIVRAADPLARYRTNNAPFPPAWPFLMRVGTVFVPDGFGWMRMLGLAIAAVFPATTGVLVANLVLDRSGRTARTRRGRATTATAASLATAAACAVLAYAMGVVQYLNDYLFQAAAVSLFVLVWYLCDRGRLSRWTVGLLFPVLPLATISGMFVLPAATVWLFWPLRAMSPGTLARQTLAPLSSLLVAGWLYVGFYRPQIDDSLSSYWAADVLRDGNLNPFERLDSMFRSVSQSVVPQPFGLRDGILVGLVVIGLSVVGQVVLARVWGWWAACCLSGFGFAIVFSYAGSWPVTAGRVNLAFLWMWMVSALVGAVVGAARAVAGREVRLFALSGFVAALLLLPVPPPGPEPYARGLYSDLAVVAASPFRRNLVVSYHFMSHFYSHDALVNLPHGDREFTVIRQRPGDRSLIDDLDGELTRAGLASFDAVWCVVPFELGPDDADLACRLGAPGWTREIDHRGTRAIIIGWFRQ